MDAFCRPDPEQVFQIDVLASRAVEHIWAHSWVVCESPSGWHQPFAAVPPPRNRTSGRHIPIEQNHATQQAKNSRDGRIEFKTEAAAIPR
jgi:hypothetical protein